MNNKRVRTKAMAMAVAAAMAVELCPVTAFAVTGDQVAADGTYSKTAHVSRTSEDDENEDIWSEYNVKVNYICRRDYYRSCRRSRWRYRSWEQEICKKTEY